MLRCVDPKIEEMIQTLDENLGTLNRQTGRNYFLLILPMSPDEEPTISLSGKPQDYDAFGASLEEVVSVALRRRQEAVRRKP